LNIVHWLVSGYAHVGLYICRPTTSLSDCHTAARNTLWRIRQYQTEIRPISLNFQFSLLIGLKLIKHYYSMWS